MSGSKNLWLLFVLVACGAPLKRDVVGPLALPNPRCAQAVEELWVAYHRGPGPRLISVSGGQVQTRLLSDLDERTRVTGFTLGDFDTDPRQEFALTLEQAGGVRVLLLDDALARHAEIARSARWPGSAEALSVGDFDADGLEDLAVSLKVPGSSSVEILSATGRGFRNTHSFDVSGWGESRYATALVAAQLDTDPALELAIGLSPGEGDRLRVAEHGPSGWELGPGLGQHWGAGRGVTALAAVQADADAAFELALGRSSGGGARLLLFDDAGRGLQQLASLGTEWGSSRGVSSLEFSFSPGPGAGRLIVARQPGPNAELFLLSLGSEQRRLSPVPYGAGADQIRSLLSLDLDGDGRRELVVSGARGAKPAGSRVVVLDDGRSRFRELAPLLRQDRPRKVVALGRGVPRKCLRNQLRAKPETLQAARAGQARRLENVVRAWRRGAKPGFGDWVRDGSTESLRRIAAGLVALQILPSADPERPGPEFPKLVENWLSQNARMHLAAGTDTSGNPIGGRAGDFDFYMMQILMLLYRFQSEPELLTDDAVWSLLALKPEPHRVRGQHSRGRTIPLIGNTPKRMTFTVGVEFPETENHVLMINTWAYLVNQWLRQNPRGDPRVARYVRRSPLQFENDGSRLEEALLAVMGRVLHQGFFETNARPYAAFSLSALQLLFSYADASTPGGRRIRVAAQNALDYAAAKFSFQSLYGKRIAPSRRNWSYRGHVGPYAGDYVVNIFGVLTGAMSADDGPGCQTVHCAYRGMQSKGFALSSALSNYRVPDELVDFMLRPDNHRTGYGAWARMQSRFTDRHYIQGRWPRTFKNVPPGAPDLPAELRAGRVKLLPAAELYFLTRDSINSAGGRYQHYSGQDGWTFGQFEHTYDWYARPTTLILDGNDGYFKTAAEGEQQFLMFIGDSDAPHLSHNLGTYKNFSYGYARAARPGAATLPANYSVLSRFRRGDIRFRVVAPSATRAPLVIYGELPKLGGFRRGFWEVLPARFKDPRSARDCVFKHNPKLSTAGRTWDYTLCVSGERLRLASDLAGAPRPILQIDGSTRRVLSQHVPPLGDAALLPLLEVRQVDADYRLTGVDYVRASGDGRLQVHNPFLRRRLWIDSSNFRDPKRRGEEY